jgi:hypothetical protein
MVQYDLAPKGDRLGQPSVEDIMAQRLALARQMSGSADRRATGATSPERPPEAPLTLGGSVASVGSGLRSSAEGLAGSVGDLSFDTGLGFRLPLAANFAPTSEDVGKGTDWMVNKLPPVTSGAIQDWTRYESKNPVERAWKWLAEQASF